jgi:hypothetical protein
MLFLTLSSIGKGVPRTPSLFPALRIILKLRIQFVKFVPVNLSFSRTECKVNDVVLLGAINLQQNNKCKTLRQYIHDRVK